MARLSDHDQRDAEDVLRAEIRLILARYARRMLEKGKAYITEAVAQAAKDEGDVDGNEIGRAAAARVRAEYFAPSKPEAAIETGATDPARQITGDAASTGETTPPADPASDQA